MLAAPVGLRPICSPVRPNQTSHRQIMGRAMLQEPARYAALQQGNKGGSLTGVGLEVGSAPDGRGLMVSCHSLCLKNQYTRHRLESLQTEPWAMSSCVHAAIRERLRQECIRPKVAGKPCCPPCKVASPQGGDVCHVQQQPFANPPCNGVLKPSPGGDVCHVQQQPFANAPCNGVLVPSPGGDAGTRRASRPGGHPAAGRDPGGGRPGGEGHQPVRVRRHAAGAKGLAGGMLKMHLRH